MSVYLDCNASSPVDPAVLDVVVYWLKQPGNAASRTHQAGTSALRAVQQARQQVAALVNCDRSEVIFTSGATESNNIAILGLAEHGERIGRRHIVTTAIEHKAVLNPLEQLRSRGFEITYIMPSATGVVSADAILAAVRDDTLLVTVMHVNNETGVLQPLKAIADGLEGHPTLLHTDAAQGFGKELESLCHNRIDLISVSGHKIYAPQGVGALIVRRRNWHRPPLTPLMFGGDQELGLRPGTVPVALVAGLGQAAELASHEHSRREACVRAIRTDALSSLAALNPQLYTQAAPTLPHVLCCRFPGIDSEAMMIALKGVVDISNGSACTSRSYSPSHVLRAMGLDANALNETVRISWCHLTPYIDWHDVATRLQPLAQMARPLVLSTDQGV